MMSSTFYGGGGDTTSEPPTSPFVDGGDLADLSRTIVDELMRRWQSKYCTYSPLTIFAGTYNVNGQPPTAALGPWLSNGLSGPPDLYVIGFQELDLSQQAFLFDSTPREQEWDDACRNALFPGTHYIPVRRVRLVGMLLLAYVNSSLLSRLTREGERPRTAVIGTGLLNRMGNKGGVGATLGVDDTTICLVNSHLAAGSDELARRNQDFREIVNGLRFADERAIDGHDLIVWLGDMNYRLEHANGEILTNEVVRRRAVGDDFQPLLLNDQLKRMQQQGHAFVDFDEAPLHFAPTYKYDVGSDRWDSSEKARVPAWCDRILWRCIDAQLAAVSYESVPELRISDHKPVRALYTAQVKKIDREKRRHCLEEALREVDRRVNEALPVVEIDRLEFDFGHIKYLEAKVQSFTVRNVGQFPVETRFRDVSPGGRVCKDWLTVTPLTTRVAVGAEHTIELQLLVDKQTAWEKSGADGRLDDVLVLHLRGGRDYFLTVHAVYTPSCFGAPLADNVSARQPTTELLIDLGDATDATAAPEGSVPPGLSVPVWRLVEEMRRRGVDTPELMMTAGSHADFCQLRDALDEHRPFPTKLSRGIHSVFEALLRLLDALPEPLVAADAADEAIRSLRDPYYYHQNVVDRMADDSRTAFVYLVQLFQDIILAGHISENDLCRNLAPVLFRLDSASADNRLPAAAEQSERKRKLDAAVRFISDCVGLQPSPK